MWQRDKITNSQQRRSNRKISESMWKTFSSLKSMTTSLSLSLTKFRLTPCLRPLSKRQGNSRSRRNRLIFVAPSWARTSVCSFLRISRWPLTTPNAKAVRNMLLRSGQCTFLTAFPARCQTASQMCHKLHCRP